MPAVTHVTSPMISSISAVIVGLVLGVYTGVAIGGMMHLDHIPFSEAHFELGRVDQGVMAVSVAPNDERELALVKHLMSEHAACSLSIDLGADLRKSTQLALASSKSA
jgi:hypothetical protein